MFNAKVAIDDIMLTDCDLHLPSSECSEVRCGNGVSFVQKIFISDNSNDIGLHKK